MKQSLKLLGLVAVIASLVGVSPAFAAAKEGKEAKERTVTGELQCAKCSLKEADACQNAIVVTGKNDKKQTLYLVENEVSKTAHGEVCKGPKKATVTGTVAKDGKKSMLTASKIDFAK